ncbi:4-alpha-glucanotransferase [Orenia metallireducens]|uniref:4-alpha-glucanotransferase n=1 Tax=Orenia metallireducens TaxID=1413210 RepID=A0A1C0A7L7_9FIRM|nr:4-alpha-glucanotransferase [Orenia metallireducens]OCL26208.1 4-alpha-glucanotransferase [Orenia metallireducens]
MEFERSSGVLLHPTSLPGKYGIGSLGKEVYEFIDFLSESKQKLWQICPLGPTGYGDSPYQSFSAFAGNPLLINLEVLKAEGLLSEEDLELEEEFDQGYVDYGRVINFKFPLYRKAFKKFNTAASDIEKGKFKAFCVENKEWLEDYTLFMSLKDHFNGRPWSEWEKPIKFREEDAVDRYKEELKDTIEFHKFMQYLFFEQWTKVKCYANEKGIKVIGDIPIFVAFDSADAWSNPEIFHFDERRNPTKVAGVPPDYFSKTGQLWGNPLYDWNKLKERGYDWWIDRFKIILKQADIVRLDHFRGFEAYWAVPAGEETAINGSWEEGSGADFFNVVRDKLGKLPIIAEDLGLITDEVEELRDEFEFPGMKILQFAFDTGEKNKYLPHNYDENCIVYTGTHDNDTTLGWFLNLSTDVKNYVEEYLDIEASNICWGLIEAAWSSIAVMAIAPLQDILSLDSGARMNTPGASSGNWQWRYKKDMLTDDIINKLTALTEKYRINDQFADVVNK